MRTSVDVAVWIVALTVGVHARMLQRVNYYLTRLCFVVGAAVSAVRVHARGHAAASELLPDATRLLSYRQHAAVGARARRALRRVRVVLSLLAGRKDAG